MWQVMRCLRLVSGISILGEPARWLLLDFVTDTKIDIES